MPNCSPCATSYYILEYHCTNKEGSITLFSMIGKEQAPVVPGRVAAFTRPLYHFLTQPLLPPIERERLQMQTIITPRTQDTAIT